VAEKIKGVGKATGEVLGLIGVVVLFIVTYA
jgi:hypothetical protein